MQTLYKRSSTGAIQQWTIFVENGSYWTEAGQVNGAITRSDPTWCERKNTGKANETTANEQAITEAKSKWDKKLRLDYSKDINTVDTAKVRNFEPMLAHKFVDREAKGKINWPTKFKVELEDGTIIEMTKEQLGDKKVGDEV